MKIEKDSRINVRYGTLIEFCMLFFVLAAFSGFHMWIYGALEDNGLLETNMQFAINLLMGYVIATAALVTASIGFARYRTWTRPIRRLGAAAREITKGNLSVRVAPLRKDGKKDLVEVLFDDFNAMTEELAFVNNNLQNLVNEKTEKVLKLQNAILATMSDLVEFRDNITGKHTERTQNGVKLLLDEINKQELFQDIVANWDIYLILQSAQLHDVGKIAISDNILKKPGSLTKDEFDEIKKHVTFGVDIIERIETDSGESDLLNHAKIFALTHHERWDGTGYPHGLRGDEIPLQGRIMAIADVYDALVSERPYKKAFTHEKAVEIIMDGKGSQFDPTLIDLFMRINDKYNEKEKKDTLNN
jgi:response regulator RpfG family c-di-GMP phosphodiesterase